MLEWLINGMTYILYIYVQYTYIYYIYVYMYIHTQINIYIYAHAYICAHTHVYSRRAANKQGMGGGKGIAFSTGMYKVAENGQEISREDSDNREAVFVAN